MRHEGHKEKRRRRSRGFSLLELLVVIVLLGGLMAIIIPAIQSLTGVEIKGEVMRMAGLTREVYAKAALSGVTHRINFDLDHNTFWVEAKEGDAGVMSPELGYQDMINNLNQERKEKDAKKSSDFMPVFKEVEGVLGEKNQLDEDLVFHGVWTDQLTEVARTGIVSLYFFQGGYTQASFISIANKGDEEDSAMYVALNPLTGAISIDFGEPNTNDLVENEAEK